MGTVKEILEFFVTFGIVDNIIIYMFFRKFGNCPKNKWYQIATLALIGSIMKFIFPSVIYQITLFIVVFIYNFFVNKFLFFKSFIITLSMFCFMLITEVMYIMILDIFKIVDFVEVNSILKQFFILIPNKIIILIYLRECNKWDLFGLVKTPKKK